MTSIFFCVLFWEKTYRICWVSSLQSVSVPTIWWKKSQSSQATAPAIHEATPPSIALVQETSNIERTKASIPNRDITSSAVDVFFVKICQLSVRLTPKETASLNQRLWSPPLILRYGLPGTLRSWWPTLISAILPESSRSPSDDTNRPNIDSSILEFWIFLSKATPAFWKHDAFRMAEKWWSKDVWIFSFQIPPFSIQ